MASEPRGNAIREVCQVKHGNRGQRTANGNGSSAPTLSLPHSALRSLFPVLCSPTSFPPSSGSICMADESNQPEQTYDEGRARNLEALLRALASRILELDAEGRLLEQAGELMRLIGDVKSELFHYEVRATYDTPEIAESRRIVREAQDNKPDKPKWDRTEWTPDDDEESEW